MLVILFYSFIFFVLNDHLEKLYQTLERVFYHISKHFKGEKLNYKVVAMEEFQTSCNGFLHFLGYDFLVMFVPLMAPSNFMNHNHIW